MSKYQYHVTCRFYVALHSQFVVHDLPKKKSSRMHINFLNKYILKSSNFKSYNIRCFLPINHISLFLRIAYHFISNGDLKLTTNIQFKYLLRYIYEQTVLTASNEHVKKDNFSTFYIRFMHFQQCSLISNILELMGINSCNHEYTSERTIYFLNETII